MSEKVARQPFEVKLEPPNPFATLSELKSVADQIQRTLNAVARNLTEEPEAVVQTEITGAEIGSLSLTLRPMISETYQVEPDGVCETLIKDINEVWHQRFRSGMTPSLLQQYRTLVNTLKSSHVRMRFQHGEEDVIIDDSFRRRFQAATKERIAGSVAIIGRIEALNIHARPYEIRLFPTMPGSDPIPCQFEDGLLAAITDEIKRKSLVRISGTGYYAPVGLYPVRLTLARAPEPLVFNPDRLRSFVRRTSLVPPGMTAAAYLEANRRAAGLAEED